MDHQRTSPSIPDSREVQRANNICATSARLRAACDSCHQAKVKCSGESPCSTCQVSNLRCVYSPASRQGRPKGSKNKRTLMQERMTKAGELHERHESAHSHQRKEIARGPLPQQQQQQQQQHHKSLSANLSLSLSHDFGSISAANHCLGDSDLLPSPPINSSCLDAAPDFYLGAGLNTAFIEQHSARAHTGSLDDANALSAQVSAELSQPWYTTSPGTLNSSCHDGEYASGGASPFLREMTMFSPHDSSSPGHGSRLSTRSSSILHCSCLQQQAQLVYRLDELKWSHDQNTTLDSVLQGVQLAHEPWQNLMHCSRCQNQAEQKEVFLLFAMSIRTLLTQLQKSNLSTVGVSVGGYELSGKFKAKVMNQLSQEALQSISAALRFLQERTGRLRHVPAAELGTSHGNDTWEAAGRMLVGASNESQMQFRQQPMPLNLGADGVASLLDTLQSTMRQWDGI